jgi:uncharacterized protein YlxP (DUF503 family)
MKQVVGLLTFEVYANHSHSLKEKRRIVKRITQRISNKFNVSISETDYQDKWQRAEISIAKIGNDYNYITRKLENILNSVEKITTGEAEILNSEIQFL